ncbi:hypothetical protein NQZ79_g5110 [Umbelopsis isabellina]|nr:hypothetical protein NQZ79_g5110 [Umbelopsis isabellina]
MAPPHHLEELPSYEDISKPALAFTQPPPPYPTDSFEEAYDISVINHEELPDEAKSGPSCRTQVILTLVAIIMICGLMIALGVLLFPASDSTTLQTGCWNPCFQKYMRVNAGLCCDGIICNSTC